MESEECEWVTPEQRVRLDELRAEYGDWPEWVPAELDDTWPGWRDAQPNELTQWLDARLNAGLSWVTDTQQAQLNELWEIRGDWREWLPVELDTHWPDWKTSTPQELAGWLDGLIPMLVMPAEEATDRFGWVTDTQQGQLAAAYPGDWRAPLTEQLDSRWGPGWDDNPDSHKQAWLDDLLPTLAMPGADLADPSTLMDDDEAVRTEVLVFTAGE